jgi:UDP-N-acetyl-2-amino-2-deoxyglucuronate dehydrogenase
MKKLNFAIIGCGKIAQRHAEHIMHMANLVATCDIEIGKAQKMADTYNSMPYNDVALMLREHSEIDVVSICSPNGLHATHSIAALKAGFHVLCEKPMATSILDCGRMISEAEKANKRLFIVKQNRYNPPVAAVKEAIDKGVFGKIYSVQLNCFWNRNQEYYSNSWKGTKDLDGGTLYTQFSHFIDLLYWMIGDIRKVFALTNNFNHKTEIEFEDTGVVAIEFFNKAIGTINFTVNSFNKNMEGSLTIFAEKGTVKIGGQYLNELEYQNIEGFEFKDLPEGAKPNNYGTYFGSMSNHDKVYQNVIDVLINNGVISTNFFEGLKTVEIIEKIYSSARINNID